MSIVLPFPSCGSIFLAGLFYHISSDVTCRRNILSNAQDLVKASKGKVELKFYSCRN